MCLFTLVLAEPKPTCLTFSSEEFTDDAEEESKLEDAEYRIRVMSFMLAIGFPMFVLLLVLVCVLVSANNDLERDLRPTATNRTSNTNSDDPPAYFTLEFVKSSPNDNYAVQHV